MSFISFIIGSVTDKTAASCYLYYLLLSSNVLFDLNPLLFYNCGLYPC